MKDIYSWTNSFCVDKAFVQLQRRTRVTEETEQSLHTHTGANEGERMKPSLG